MYLGLQFNLHVFGRLELLPELKLEALQIITRLIIQRLCDADFKGAHGGDPGDGDAGGITQALLFRPYAPWPPHAATVHEGAQAH